MTKLIDKAKELNSFLINKDKYKEMFRKAQEEINKKNTHITCRVQFLELVATTSVTR